MRVNANPAPGTHPEASTGEGLLSRTDLAEHDCPPDIVDRLLWRNAQRVLDRHAVRLDGTCHWCGRPSPCAARTLGERAVAVSRQPWHEAWAARNEITRLLPVLAMDFEPGRGPGRPAYRRNERAYD
jgi:hypothetical protein